MSDSMFKYVKRWQELERKQKDLDYERSVFAKELRAEFGNNGDARFVKWCKDELGLTEVGANELLLRATMVKTVGDEKTWKNLGGFRAIRAVEVLPREKRVHVIEAAKTTGKSVATLVRENCGVPQTTRERVSPISDAEVLAKFITSHHDESRLPPAVRTIVARYAPLRRAA